jgi:hypothetical protein
MDWSNDQQIPNVGISGSPALVFYNQQLVCVHEGEGNSGYLWYTTFDGREWSPDAMIPNLRTSGGPGLAVFKGMLYCAHQGYGDNGELWWTTFDGKVWSDDRQVPNVGISASPALLEFVDQAGNPALWCVYEGYGDSIFLEYTVTTDGVTWSEAHQGIPTAVTGGGPGLAAFKGKLYVAYQGSGDEGGGNGELWWTTFDGNEWSDEQQVPNVGISGSPTLAEYRGGLVCVHEGEGGSGSLWYITYDGITWSQDQEIPNLGTSGGPSLAPYYDGTLYCAHQGYGDNGELWWTAAGTA